MKRSGTISYDAETKSKVSWTKLLVRKWFQIKTTKNEDFQSESDLDYSGGDEGLTTRFADREPSKFRKSKTVNKRSSERLRTDESYQDSARSQITHVDNYRIFVSTWNVAGKSPPSNLSLEDWLHTSPPADIYVLGFQEVVPLNAGNVLVAEDNGPARKWVSLIGKTLNDVSEHSGCGYSCALSHSRDQVEETEPEFECSTVPYFHRRTCHSLNRSLSMNENDHRPILKPKLTRRYSSVCDRIISRSSNGNSSDDEYGGPCGSPNTTYYSPVSSYSRCAIASPDQLQNSRYCLVADKQMVGIFLTVWVRRELQNSVRNVRVSCVSRGLLGYLGNKGSISISLKLHQTNFCFVCSHLSSGQKEGDELRRNSDVLEILRKTKFRKQGFKDSPRTILDHDRVIWLGDLNYRLALSYRCTKALLEMHNWKALLDRDQLRVERRKGRVFQGWKEGRIYFPPTYKYSYNSDQYAGDAMQGKLKRRRTPAWCDRILWYGGGIRQLSYVRGESRFSDHRPVFGVFLVRVESIDYESVNRSSSYLSSKIEVEELLPFPHKCGNSQGLHCCDCE